MKIAADNMQIINKLIEREIKEFNLTPVQDLVRRCEGAALT